MADDSEFLKPNRYGDLQDIRLPEDVQTAGPNQLRLQKEAAEASPGLWQKLVGWATTPTNKPNPANDLKAKEEEAQGLPSMSMAEEPGFTPVPETSSALPNASPVAPADLTPAAAARPVPLPAAKGRGSAAPTMVMEPMDITAPAPASTADVSAPTAPAAPTTAAPAPSKSSEEQAWEAAQTQVDDAAVRSKISDVLAAFTSNPDAIWKRNAEQRSKPFQDVLNKYNYLQQVQKNKADTAKTQRETDLSDPNSATTKRNAAMLFGMGIKVPEGFTADQTSDYVNAWKLQGDAREKELNRLREESRDKEFSRHNRAEESQQRYATDALRAEKEAALGAKGKAKEIPADQLLSLSGAGTGAQEVLNQADAFNKVGGLGLVGGDSANFKKNREAGALKIAIGENPKARESLSAKTEGLADTYLPQASDFHETGMTKLANSLLRTNNGVNERINAYGSGGYNTAPLDNERRQVRQATAEFIKRHGKGVDPTVRQKLLVTAGLSGPHGQSVTQNGQTFTWNPDTGQYE